MIKILKNGEMPKPTKVIYQATCKDCGCEFEFELEDCKETEKRPNGYMVVECPYCHKDIKQCLFKYRTEEYEPNEH